MENDQPFATSTVDTRPKSSARFQVEDEESTKTTEAREEVDELRKSTSIKNRLTYFEVSSIVRSARNQKEEDLQEVNKKHMVNEVLKEFMENKVVLAGRQMPSAGMEQQTDSTGYEKSTKGNTSTDDPDHIYAVPDPNRKSAKSQRSRPDSNRCDSISEASTASLPVVPEKV